MADTGNIKEFVSYCKFKRKSCKTETIRNYVERANVYFDLIKELELYQNTGL